MGYCVARTNSPYKYRKGAGTDKYLSSYILRIADKPLIKFVSSVVL